MPLLRSISNPKKIVAQGLPGLSHYGDDNNARLARFAADFYLALPLVVFLVKENSFLKPSVLTLRADLYQSDTFLRWLKFITAAKLNYITARPANVRRYYLKPILFA